jgi:hypothetical protein
MNLIAEWKITTKIHPVRQPESFNFPNEKYGLSCCHPWFFSDRVSKNIAARIRLVL